MIRKIIKINKDKCNGCGVCAEACHEGAIGMVEGKAQLLRDDYCDGLGDCLPVCPTDAISFENREAAPYDEAAVEANLAAKAHASAAQAHASVAQGCPGSHARTLERDVHAAPAHHAGTSQLAQWPVQIKLAPLTAPYFDSAHLLIAADCCAYAYSDFHEGFMRNRITLIGCPKLDEGDYSEKLAEIIKHNDIRSLTVVRMEVPCCGGLEYAVRQALEASGKTIPLQVITLTTDGRILV